MESVKTNTLEAPGAELYYEVRGSGPVLLLICGGVYDAGGYAGLAAELAGRYTVVTYDRRGNSRSPLAGPPEPQRIEVHGDDAHRVLSAAGVTADAPAYVFGNSSGAMIGLELAARHPEQVRALVAHEPPLFELLPDRDHWRGVVREVADAFRKEGPEAAGAVLRAAFAAAGVHVGGPAEEGTPGDMVVDTPGDMVVDTPGDMVVDAAGDTGQERVPGGGHAPQGEPDPETMEMLGRFAKNMEFFIGYEVPPFSGYTLDVAALRASGVRITAAAGADSAGEPPNRAARAVAELLGTSPVVFPGDHGGFGALSEAFAARLHEVLSAS
ncbi:hypothetical protein Misp01_76790 [Microtetraspora sp. NBRC 13810]|uniref:alpha/beta fold hydrolase n=1 Tax=Microtetraspora sp. NBRC 13810 TaxID=3030990 RepID=UPI0024A21F9D|nr:alpha/beta fold hydrolase [Microtetraspora sp. NBRC 13810]GLW12551.1 hypothetical protein Misp01_76790 [Microtetraspora sp. NBRC 13810]